MRTRTHAPPPTHTQKYDTYCSSTATLVSLTRLNITLHVHCLSCYTDSYGGNYKLGIPDMLSTSFVSPNEVWRPLAIEARIRVLVFSFVWYTLSTLNGRTPSTCPPTRLNETTPYTTN